MSTLREKIAAAIKKFPIDLHITPREHYELFIDYLAEELKTAALIDRAEDHILGARREGLMLEVKARGPEGVVDVVLSRVSDGANLGSEMLHLNVVPDGNVRWCSSPTEPIILRAMESGSKHVAVTLDLTVLTRVLEAP